MLNTEQVPKNHGKETTLIPENLTVHSDVDLTVYLRAQIRLHISKTAFYDPKIS